MALFPATRVHRMSAAILEKLVSGYMATDQSCYAFAWQGGEPLLMGLDFFRRATDFQSQYGRPGVTVQNSLQTNGVLITDDLAKHFLRYRFLLGVSLDGLESIHDMYRVNAAGDGSFSAVWRGIECLRRNNVDFNILTLVTRANIRRGREVYQYLCEHGFLFQQYIPCVEVDAHDELLPYSISGEAWGEFLCKIYDQWIRHDTRRVSIRLFDSILNIMVDNQYVDCTMRPVCDTYFVVEHNGDIFPCDFFVESQWCLGNIATAPWNGLFAGQLHQQFSRRKSNRNAACSVCEWRPYCAGDCPKHRPAPVGDTRPVSRLCRGWKIFYTHVYPGLQRLADQIRKERMPDRTSAGDAGKQSGRNDPCPCGSGLKYKKCCQRIKL